VGFRASGGGGGSGGGDVVVVDGESGGAAREGAVNAVVFGVLADIGFLIRNSRFDALSNPGLHHDVPGLAFALGSDGGLGLVADVVGDALGGLGIIKAKIECTILILGWGRLAASESKVEITQSGSFCSPYRLTIRHHRSIMHGAVVMAALLCVVVLGAVVFPITVRVAGRGHHHLGTHRLLLVVRLPFIIVIPRGVVALTMLLTTTTTTTTTTPPARAFRRHYRV
jgi:hypothetical protein